MQCYFLFLKRKEESVPFTLLFGVGVGLFFVALFLVVVVVFSVQYQCILFILSANK